MNRLISLLAAAALFLVAGCNTLPDQVAALEQAKQAVQELEAQPMAEARVGTELDRAQRYLAEAQSTYDSGGDLEVIEHKAYMAQRYADIGAKRLASDQLEEEIAQARAERKRILLQQKSREAELAREQAEQYRRESEEMAAAAMSARAEVEQLRQQMQELDAKQTERGMVLTLGEVLFATDKAELREGAEPTLNKLAAFMREYPDRRILIEGHTDATGDEVYNLGLSKKRAEAVEQALQERGVKPGRIEVVPLGEEYPVASNETASGRQQNRRVEIVISGPDGGFPEDAYRETGVALRSSAVFHPQSRSSAWRAALFVASDLPRERQARRQPQRLVF